MYVHVSQSVTVFDGSIQLLHIMCVVVYIHNQSSKVKICGKWQELNYMYMGEQMNSITLY